MVQMCWLAPASDEATESLLRARAPTRRVICHVKNKTLIAIATQHTDTYGDNRSPIRAAFQNRPNTLLGSHTHVSAAQHGQSEGRARQREHPNVRGEQAQGTGDALRASMDSRGVGG